jgi:SAM-dependent methyltransferase
MEAMLNKMHVPDTAVRYILFQRTTYLRFIKTALYRTLDKRLGRVVRKVLHSSIYIITVNVEASMGKQRIKKLYAGDMLKEYLMMKEYLPTSCATVLDIGCGVAGIDVFINQHYRNSNIRFYLLDKTSIDGSVYYGFRQKGAFYNSLSVAKELLYQNSVPENNILLLKATDTADVNVGEKVDLVISLLSWGFHYPVSTYLEKVYSLLSDNGKLILDVRRETDGLVLLENKFNTCIVLTEQEKCFRILCTK